MRSLFTTIITLSVLSLLLLPLLLLLFHHFTSAALCQFKMLEVAALLDPSLVEGRGYSNLTSCRFITFLKEFVVMAYLEMDCMIVVDKGEVEMTGIECDQLEEQGLLVDLVGIVMVELKEDEMVALYSGEGLYLC